MNNHFEEMLQPAQSLLVRVFAFMAAAVGISGVTAVVLGQNLTIWKQYPYMLFILLIAQLAIVMILSWRLMSLSYGTAQLLFFSYAILSGATLSVIFGVYTTASIARVFFIAAAMFAGMAVYGAYTSINLARYRSLFIMTLWGMIIALLVNLFLGSSMLDMTISLVGVFLFAALTAYDIQNILKLSAVMLARQEDWNKIALIGALQLYLDFVNLFLSLLRLFGRQRE